VYTHRTSSLESGKALGSSERNASLPKATSPTAAVKPSQPSAVPRSVTTLIAAAGLPADKLSASIISFARFFSLPIKPELMAAIRRQSLSPTAQQTNTSPPSMTAPQSNAANLAETISPRAANLETLAKNREALSLAAAAIKDKGAELNPEKLETYTEAIDPDWQKRNSGRNSQEQRHKEQKKEDNAKAESDANNKTIISASDIKKLILESKEKEPLLSILNRLPGKNGQFWLVYPFDFCESGREFKVSLRILMDKDNSTENGVRHMALDIVEHGEHDCRWLFVPVHTNKEAVGISKNGALKSGVISRLMLYIEPELPPKALASLAHKMSRIMEIPLENIAVKNMTESFPIEPNGGNDLWCTVNEAV
jgi:hypothetical protein